MESLKEIEIIARHCEDQGSSESKVLKVLKADLDKKIEVIRSSKIPRI